MGTPTTSSSTSSRSFNAWNFSKLRTDHSLVGSNLANEMGVATFGNSSVGHHKKWVKMLVVQYGN